MLRIKESVNLKELEKFGLKYKKDEDDFEMYEWISETTDRFEYVDVYIWNREITVGDANDILYDLIKAGLEEIIGAIELTLTIFIILDIIQLIIFIIDKIKGE